jgi:hypothetical protein
VSVPDSVAPNSSLRLNLIIQAKDVAAPAGIWYAKVLGMTPNTPSFIVRCYSVPRGTSGVPACNS